ncbi:hypothetical protein WK80_25820 [Burkholderia multivorans]|nr:hypothetical protein WK80_25820 [Burkholderia multivorans]
MIAHAELISRVLKGDNEYFFLYKKKYKWSIANREDGISLWYYPGQESLESLRDVVDVADWRGIDMIRYTPEEIGTKEARASFAELFTLVKEKYYGINEVLDDIISDDDI